jgi:hypothetical protein
MQAESRSGFCAFFRCLRVRSTAGVSILAFAADGCRRLANQSSSLRALSRKLKSTTLVYCHWVGDFGGGAHEIDEKLDFVGYLRLFSDYPQE